MLNQNIESQMEEDDEKTYKTYVWLMDSQFFILINKLIEIINYMLKSENWTK